MPLRSLGLGTAALAATTAIAAAALIAPPVAAATAAAGPHPKPAAEAAGHHRYIGKITARSGLLLRDRPTRSSRVLRSEPYGAIVNIFCKTRGDRVNGNSQWYLLTDGTWAWASAAYIANIGPAPRWC